jgi:chromosome segregation ATPase
MNAAIQELTERLAFAEKNLAGWKARGQTQAAAVVYAQNDLNRTEARIAGIGEEIGQLRSAIAALNEIVATGEDGK